LAIHLVEQLRSLERDILRFSRAIARHVAPCRERTRERTRDERALL
jgi:hypothetical protein